MPDPAPEGENVFVEQAAKVTAPVVNAMEVDEQVLAQGAAQPAFQPVTIDGTTYETAADLSAAVMLRKDYTRKTMETAALKHRLEEQLGQGESGRPVQGPGDLWIGENGVERNTTGADAPGGLQDAVRPDPQDAGQPEGAPNGRALPDDDDDVPTRAELHRLRDDLRQEIQQTVGADTARRERGERLIRQDQEIADMEARLPGYTAAVEVEMANMKYEGGAEWARLTELGKGSKSVAYNDVYMTRVAPRAHVAPSHIEGGTRVPTQGDTGPLADVTGPDERELLIAHMQRGGQRSNTE